MRLIGIVIVIAIAATIAADRLSKDTLPAKSNTATARPVEGLLNDSKSSANGSGVSVPAAESQARAKTRQLPLAADAPGCYPGQPMTLAADRGGHFFTDVEINGRTLNMVVDTGATTVTIPNEEALRLGLNLASGRKSISNTANGPVETITTRAASLRVGPICLFDIDVAVLPPRALKQGLLGMNVIGKMKRFELSDSRLTIAR